ncbi:ArsR/SmtB family transcription factor [Pukyongiella litopenaei]|uniref:Helix-turn-helix transcriptional regulator n=1 Tax=Pukyongiella litopenaei TaxID=2605946 RepID=A0A2S0MSU9_9RHOB|nr:metalloregulator ArsR/SmtB family transcription factor [Pukyongiella litopenaei]AVO38960.1 helix-turn-helix transcriptional regulator [Pukyongiella litopenaei]
MEKTDAIAALSALAHDLRIDIFRRLTRAGDHGMPAGELATAIGARPNTVSNNLALLTAAGLIRSRREGRSIRYFARMDGMRDLLGFLMEDCCGGRPELCQPVLDRLACATDAADPTEPADPATPQP